MIHYYIWYELAYIRRYFQAWDHASFISNNHFSHKCVIEKKILTDFFSSSKQKIQVEKILNLTGISEKRVLKSYKCNHFGLLQQHLNPDFLQGEMKSTLAGKEK